jgi:hypothetical protein
VTPVTATSGLAQRADVLAICRHIGNVPIGGIQLAQVEGMMHKALQIKIKGRWY